jgi:hypothetical protein
MLGRVGTVSPPFFVGVFLVDAFGIHTLKRRERFAAGI